MRARAPVLWRLGRPGSAVKQPLRARLRVRVYIIIYIFKYIYAYMSITYWRVYNGACVRHTYCVTKNKSPSYDRTMWGHPRRAK